MTSASVIVPTLNGRARIERLLDSLADADAQIVVVDNGSTDGTAQAVRERVPEAIVVELDHNAGYSRAVNLGARRAEGDVLVLLNDDCVCERGFVERIAAAAGGPASTVMAAGVLVEATNPTIIDTAGMELDETLLVFDYLNGRPVSVLARGVEPPVGPSGAAAAFDRAAFLEVGGFDEELFAYWEDVDLVLRLRRLGGRCALVPDARGSHAHSATLGSGSTAKNYLTGFGRGYVLRKWSVVSPRSLGHVLARDAPICAAQIVVDRTAAGVRGRVDGWRAAAAVARQPRPDARAIGRHGSTVLTTFRRRLARRRRLRAQGRSAGF